MKFRKKPIIVDAVQFTEKMAKADTDQLPRGVVLGYRSMGPPPERELWNYHFYVNTPEGLMVVEIGDWIITGIKGERYPCKPDIFSATYEPADLGIVVEENKP